MATNGITTACSRDVYQSPFTTRYCKNSPMIKLFSETHRVITMRNLWVWLAEAELDCGLDRISQEMIDEMKANVTNIDWQYIEDEEKLLRHDVMAHIHAFEKVCPKAQGIIHLGATSCYVQDNADLIILRDAAQTILQRTADCLKVFVGFCRDYADFPTTGRTHYQVASVVTVGKRGAIWAQGLLLALKQLENSVETLRFRGVKGATGTQDSFLKLFDGDADKVRRLDKLVTAKAGYSKKFIITGQTYDRKLDTALLVGLADIAETAHKVCMDLRMLQANGEMMEPFESTQVGSSAMPYKRNPMRCERVCSLARYLLSLPSNAYNTAALQGFERTLDDSANRRLVLPDAFLTAEAMLMTFENILQGMRVQHERTQRLVADEMPFLALEEVLMRMTKTGSSRQEAHEKIRQVSLAANERRQKGERVTLKDILESDAYFANVVAELSNLNDFEDLEDASRFVGRCSEQVREFIADELLPAINKYPTDCAYSVNLDV